MSTSEPARRHEPAHGPHLLSAAHRLRSHRTQGPLLHFTVFALACFIGWQVV